MSSAGGNIFQRLLRAVAYQAMGWGDATQQGRWVGATAAGAPTTGTYAVGDFVVTQDGGFAFCVTAGTPGTWKILVGG